MSGAAELAFKKEAARLLKTPPRAGQAGAGEAPAEDEDEDAVRRGLLARSPRGQVRLRIVQSACCGG